MARCALGRGSSRADLRTPSRVRCAAGRAVVLVVRGTVVDVVALVVLARDNALDLLLERAVVNVGARPLGRRVVRQVAGVSRCEEGGGGTTHRPNFMVESIQDGEMY